MNLPDIKDKIVLITGSNKGLGKVFVESFAENKAEIISCSRKQDSEHEKFCEELKNKYKIKIHNYFFDLENVDEMSSNIKSILTNFSKIDILINNAGVNFTSLIEMTSLERLRKVYEVNFFSTYFITQKILKLLKKSKEPSIINISSSASIENNVGRFAYASSKQILNSFTKTLSKEVGRYKIRVNAIAPGWTNTKMMKETTTDKNVEETIKRISMARIGEPEEIAKLVLFLGSNVSSYINGQIISIDGGLNESL